MEFKSCIAKIVFYLALAAVKSDLIAGLVYLILIVVLCPLQDFRRFLLDLGKVLVVVFLFGSGIK